MHDSCRMFHTCVLLIHAIHITMAMALSARHSRRRLVCSAAFCLYFLHIQHTPSCVARHRRCRTSFLTEPRALPVHSPHPSPIRFRTQTRTDKCALYVYVASAASKSVCVTPPSYSGNPPDALPASSHTLSNRVTPCTSTRTRTRARPVSTGRQLFVSMRVVWRLRAAAM